MHYYFTRSPLAFFVAAAIACSDGPSAPNAGALPAAGGISMSGAVLLSATDYEEVVREAHLVIDGAVAFRQVFAPPSAATAFVFPTVSISPGSHTVAVRVVSQTVSSQMYELRGSIMLNVRGAQKLVSIPPTQRRLRAGEVIEHRFDADF